MNTTVFPKAILPLPQCIAVMYLEQTDSVTDLGMGPNKPKSE